MNPDSGPHNYGTRAAALRKKKTAEEVSSTDQPTTGTADASQSFLWRPSVFCPVTHELISCTATTNSKLSSRDYAVTNSMKRESVTPVKTQQGQDTQHRLVKPGNPLEQGSTLTSPRHIDAPTNKFKSSASLTPVISPSLAPSQSPSPFPNPQEKLSSLETSSATASSIPSSLQCSSPLPPSPATPTPPQKPELPKKRKIMVDGGPVLTQPSAGALHVSAAETQPQPPVKRLRPDAEVVQQTNHDANVQNQPMITSGRLDLSRSEAHNGNEFIVNPSSVVPPPNLEEPEHTTIQVTQASDHEERNTNGSQAFVSPTNHPIYFYSEKNVLIELSRVRFNLPPILIDGSRFFQRLLATSESDNRLDSQAGEHGRISVALVEKQDLTGNTLYVLDKIPLSLDDFVALLDFMRDLLRCQYVYKNFPFKTLAPVLRAGTTLEYTSITSIASRSLYLLWNPSWDTTIWDLETDLMSFEVPFAPLPPGTIVDLIESTILVHSIGAKNILKRNIYELASASNANPHQGVDPLPPQIKTLVETMRGKLQLAWNTIAAVPSDIQCSSTADLEGSGSCIAKNLASINARNVAHRDIVHNSWMFQKYWGNPMGGIEALVDSAERWREKGYCEGCVKTQVEGWNRAKENLWLELDEYV